jgi:hypothetical protein
MVSTSWSPKMEPSIEGEKWATIMRSCLHSHWGWLFSYGCIRALLTHGDYFAGTRRFIAGREQAHSPHPGLTGHQWFRTSLYAAGKGFDFCAIDVRSPFQGP